MTCPNPPTYLFQGIDQNEADLPPKFSCPEHVVSVLRWFIVDNSVRGAWIEPFEEGQIAAEDKCSYVTNDEIKSILDSKRRIISEVERRIAKGEL